MQPKLLKISNYIDVPDKVRIRFTNHEIFILDNLEVQTKKPIFKMMWEPESGEFLMGVYPENHKQLLSFGNHPFDSYLRGIYIKEKKEVVTRPYWNPAITQEYDKILSNQVQEAFKKILQSSGRDNVSYRFNITNQNLIEEYGIPKWVV